MPEDDYKGPIPGLINAIALIGIVAAAIFGSWYLVTIILGGI